MRGTGVIPTQVAPTLRPNRADGGEEEREEEHVRRPDPRGVVCAWQGELHRHPFEHARSLLDDLAGGPAVDGVDVCPGDQRRDQHDPRQLLEQSQEPEPEERQSDELRDVERRAQPCDVEQDAERDEPEPDGEQPPRVGEREEEPSDGERGGDQNDRDERDVEPVGDARQLRGDRVPYDERHEQPRERPTRPPSAQYGGSSAHHVPSVLKAFQKLVFADCSSSDIVDVGRDEPVDRRREPLELSCALRVERPCERKLERREERDRLAAHRDDEARLHDVELPRQPPSCVGGVLGAELEAIRAVDRQRVDVEALQRLEERLPGAAEERHALLDLARQSAGA